MRNLRPLHGRYRLRKLQNEPKTSDAASTTARMLGR